MHMPHGNDKNFMGILFNLPEEEVYLEEDFSGPHDEFRSTFESLRRKAAQFTLEEFKDLKEQSYGLDRSLYADMRRCRTVDPEKKATFDDFFDRCRDIAKDAHGIIRIQDSNAPHLRDIHIFASSLMLDNAFVPDLLLDMGILARCVEISPEGEGIHLQISLPYYNLKL
ncbi:MAG: hypothetical protein IKY34_01770 [Ruminiclostridium sp.]|nr:hypothetical protein [Ruminiclostridium sp.]